MRRIILTASGGAFRDWPVERLKEVTAADAVKHPNWRCGRCGRHLHGQSNSSLITCFAHKFQAVGYVQPHPLLVNRGGTRKQHGPKGARRTVSASPGFAMHQSGRESEHDGFTAGTARCPWNWAKT